jgi:DNA-binding transcriptional LysR family regulator
MDLLSGMHLFARMAETGGFTARARESGASQPTISRTIAALEAHLGVRLLNRSDARHFYERARGALEVVAEAESSVGRRRGEPSGLLPLGMPAALDRLHVAPRIPAFLERQPQVAVELAMDDSFVDLVGEGLDLSIRVGDLADPSLIAPVWLFQDEIERGLVRIVLERFEPKRPPIHAVYPSRRLLAAKVRAMMDSIAAEFAGVRMLSIA